MKCRTRTCLSFSPSGRAFSTIVNIGTPPSAFTSSASPSKSQGSKAVLFLPSKADPACDDLLVRAPPFALPFATLSEPLTSSSFHDDNAFATRRLERPLVAVARIASVVLYVVYDVGGVSGDACRSRINNCNLPVVRKCPSCRAKCGATTGVFHRKY